MSEKAFLSDKNQWQNHRFHRLQPPPISLPTRKTTFGRNLGFGRGQPGNLMGAGWRLMGAIWGLAPILLGCSRGLEGGALEGF